MFYHHELLKKNGRFHICWLADSYPGGFLRITSRQIRQYHVSEISDDLIQVINSESHNPRKKFSLRLSSQLVMGLLRLYHRQIKILIGDLLSFDASVRRGVQRLQKPPKIKKPKKSTPPKAEEPLLTQQELLVQLNNTNVVQRIGDITLRETVLPPTIVIQDTFGEEQDPVLQLYGQPEDVLRMQDASVLDQTTFQVQADIHADCFGRKLNYLGGSPHRPTMLDVTQTVKDMSVLEAAEVQITPDTSKVMEELNLPNINVSLVPEINIIPAPEISEVAIHSTPVRTDKALDQEKDEQIDVTPMPPKNKKKKVKIIDQETFLPNKYMLSRIFKDDIELRCKNVVDDKITFGSLFSSKRLLTLPYMENENVRLALRMSRYSKRHQILYTRNGITRPEPSMQLRTTKTRQGKENEVIRVAKKEETSLRNITAGNFSIDQTTVQAKTLPLVREQQHPAITSFKRKSEDADKITPLTTPLCKKKSSVKMSEVSLEITMKDIQMDISNNITEDQQVQLPGDQISSHEQSKIPDIIEEVTEDFKAAGDSRVFDNMDKSIHEPESVKGRRSEKDSSPNETGLGSLDRTKVSLGDQSLSESVKAAMDYLSQCWSPEAFLDKMWAARREGIRPMTIKIMVKQNAIPTDIVSEKMVAVRAFMSLLRLKSTEILKVKKNMDDLSILHITIGNKLRHTNLAERK